MSAPPVAVIVITFNEEDRVARTLESVSWAAEIVVVDSGSTDRTEEIARRYTPHFHTRDWPGYGAQKQRALELATAEWVLEVDADEVVTPALRDAILRAVADPGAHAGFTVERPMHFLGTWFGARGWHRERKLRLVRRDRARFRPAKIHEALVVDGAVGHLRAPLLHYSYRDLSHRVAKINDFTSIIAADRRARGRTGGVGKALLHGWGYFMRSYVVQGGFLLGRAGVVEAVANGFNGFLKHAKMWELERAGAAAPPPPGGAP